MTEMESAGDGTETVEQHGGGRPPEIASLLDPEVQDDPFSTYATMRELCPVFFMPEMDLHVVTRFEDAKQVLTDPATFSNNPSARGARPSESAKAAAKVFREQGWVRARTLQRTDPPVHTRYRRLLAGAFTKRRVRSLVPRMDELCHQLIDGFIDRGEVEFVNEFALPLPGIVICEQLGLDASEYPRFKRWADAMLAATQRVLSVEEATTQAEIELDAQHHLKQEFERRREQPTDDLISALVTSEVDGTSEHLSIEELQDLMHQLITGGFETTTAALSTGMWLLLRYPDQMEKLRADGSLLENFIDESLRFDSPVAGLWRTAVCPATVAGTEIPADSSVMVRYAAANRDGDRFEDPDRFDIERHNAGDHLAFGWGNHYCVGAQLARAELRSAFRALLDRLDRIELARPLDELPHEPSFFLRPMKELPLRFEPRSAVRATAEVDSP